MLARTRLGPGQRTNPHVHRCVRFPSHATGYHTDIDAITAERPSYANHHPLCLTPPRQYEKARGRIVEAHPEIDTLDVKALGKNEYPNLHEYHLIGVATGIYYSEIDKDMARVLTNVLQPQDKVFGLMTYGGKNKWYGKDIDGICRMRQAIFMGVYGCPGFDTWGPFKLTGGVQKGHPTAEEIKGAVDFFDKIEDEYGDIIVEEYAKREKRLAYEKEHPAGGLVAGVKRTAKKIANKL